MSANRPSKKDLKIENQATQIKILTEKLHLYKLLANNNRNLLDGKYRNLSFLMKVYEVFRMFFIKRG
ncbi:MAG: hypothetical protein KKB82_06190 [Candidatus Omnitrophica bacterium]|nr:hypothetical protein [Candidatus Omnitrophota bacterium]